MFLNFYQHTAHNSGKNVKIINNLDYFPGPYRAPDHLVLRTGHPGPQQVHEQSATPAAAREPAQRARAERVRSGEPERRDGGARAQPGGH